MATTTNMNPTKPEETLKNKGQDLINTAGDRAKDAMSNLGDKARDAAHTVTDRARDAAHTVTDRARDAVSNIGGKAEDATHSVGKGMESVAGTLRDKLPREGVLGAAGSSVADCLESSGRYLEQEGLEGMAKDVTNLIRRNPFPAVLAGIALGYLIARVTTRS